MSVKVMIKRRVPKARKKELLPLIIELRKLATVQPGYIGGETLVNADDLEEYLVVSTWQSLDHWRDWRLSEARKRFDDRLETLLDDPTEYNAYFYGDPFLYQNIS